MRPTPPTPPTPAVPNDGDELACLVYREVVGAWLYDASYSSRQLCQRRADHLSEAFGVTFTLYWFPEGWYAGVSVVWTAVIRAALTNSGQF